MSSNIESNELLCDVVRKPNCDVTLTLINGGCDINYVDKEGRCVLLHACFGAHISQIKLLLEKGAKVDKILGKLKLNGSRDLQIVKLLVDHGADPNEIGGDKRFLLSQAVNLKNVDAVDQLLSLPSVKVDVHSGNGITALRWACVSGLQLITRLLLNKGADPNIIGDGSTPFLRSIEMKKYDIVQMLLSHDISVNVQDNTGNSALHYAAKDNKPDFVYQLLVLGADINLKNNEGKTPVDLCDTDELKWVVQNYEKVAASRVDTAKTVHMATGISEKDDTTKTVHSATGIPEKCDSSAVSIPEKDDIARFVVPPWCKKPNQTIVIGKVYACNYQVWDGAFKCWSNWKEVPRSAECEYIVNEKIPYHTIAVADKWIRVRFSTIYSDLGNAIRHAQIYEGYLLMTNLLAFDK